eukprot:TRINITY_DN14770_c0_g1_i1.p1 TRINITY_DN14770_c0_g1~~TRINITY_DN14770_c0_g1_i1.p1  ORF type:complete len:760 (+),score=98.88 TRINITY_DN14770_c0_g1_i1:96-2375(+)
MVAPSRSTDAATAVASTPATEELQRRVERWTEAAQNFFKEEAYADALAQSTKAMGALRELALLHRLYNGNLPGLRLTAETLQQVLQLVAVSGDLTRTAIETTSTEPARLLCLIPKLLPQALDVCILYRSWIYIKETRLDEAAELLRGRQVAGCRLPETFFLMAILQAQQRHFDRALAETERCVAMADCSSPQAMAALHIIRGEIKKATAGRRKNGGTDGEDALAEYGKALKLDMEWARRFVGRGLGEQNALLQEMVFHYAPTMLPGFPNPTLASQNAAPFLPRFLYLFFPDEVEPEPAPTEQPLIPPAELLPVPSSPSPRSVTSSPPGIGVPPASECTESTSKRLRTKPQPHTGHSIQLNFGLPGEPVRDYRQPWKEPRFSSLQEQGRALAREEARKRELQRREQERFSSVAAPEPLNRSSSLPARIPERSAPPKRRPVSARVPACAKPPEQKANESKTQPTTRKQRRAHSAPLSPSKPAWYSRMVADKERQRRTVAKERQPRSSPRTSPQSKGPSAEAECNDPPTDLSVASPESKEPVSVEPAHVTVTFDPTPQEFPGDHGRAECTSQEDDSPKSERPDQPPPVISLTSQFVHLDFPNGENWELDDFEQPLQRTREGRPPCRPSSAPVQRKLGTVVQETTPVPMPRHCANFPQSAFVRKKLGLADTHRADAVADAAPPPTLAVTPKPFRAIKISTAPVGGGFSFSHPRASRKSAPPAQAVPVADSETDIALQHRPYGSALAKQSRYHTRLRAALSYQF